MSTDPTFDTTGVSFDDTGYTFDGGRPTPTGVLVMPNLVGLEIYDGIEVLELSGVLIPGKIGYFGTYPVSAVWVQSSIAPGTILTQSIIAGTGIPTVNPSITLTVSQYPMSVSFP